MSEWGPYEKVKAMWAITIPTAIIVFALVLYGGQVVGYYDVAGKVVDIDYDKGTFPIWDLTTIYFDDGRVLTLEGHILKDITLNHTYAFTFWRTRIGRTGFNGSRELLK